MEFVKYKPDVAPAESPLDQTIERLKTFLTKRWKCDFFVAADPAVWKAYAELLHAWLEGSAKPSWRAVLRRAESRARATRDIRPGRWAEPEGQQ